MKKTETKTKLNRDEGTFNIRISLRIPEEESVKNDFYFGFEKDFLITMNVMLDNIINDNIVSEKRKYIRLISEQATYDSPYFITYHIPYTFNNYDTFQKVYLQIRQILKNIYIDNKISGIVCINGEETIDIKTLIDYKILFN